LAIILIFHLNQAKISKKSWVLRECTERVPETAAAAKELLIFGLQATSKKELINAADGKFAKNLTRFCMQIYYFA
jgi:neuroblastoma-amplified sequence